VPELEVRARQSPAERCPYCHDCLEGGVIADVQVVCEGCGTSHHQACFAELGGCTLMGCPGGRAQPEGGLEEIRARIRSRVDRFVSRNVSRPGSEAQERMARHWSCSKCHLDFAVSDCPSCGTELLRRCDFFARHCTGCEKRFSQDEIVGLELDPDEGAQIRKNLFWACFWCVLGGLLLLAILSSL